MSEPDSAAAHPQFTTTHWSVVVAAGTGSAPAAHDALERLCRTYWYPLYAFIRRLGHSPADAQDLTQGFFAYLLDHQLVARANRQAGRFRSFLLGSLKHFIAHEHERATALKEDLGPLLFSPDGTTLAAGRFFFAARPRTAHLWRAPSFKEIEAAEAAKAKTR